MSNFRAYITILKALVKNKLRFGSDATKSKKVATVILFGFAYVMILAYALLVTVSVGASSPALGITSQFYFALLLMAGAFVLIFGIIALVSTLYLAKDTDFYSILPVKSTVIFAAKITFVYISELVIVLAVLIPVLVVYGIVIGAWAWYYVISLLMAFIVPALPLAVASIIAIPVMFVAGKLKNRNIIPLIFYTVLFVGVFALYMYFILQINSIGEDGITDDQLMNFARTMEIIRYVFYPFAALSNAALGIPSYGLSVAASTVVELVIFAACSAVLIGVLLLLGNLMYSRSVKENNQTTSSVAKKGEFKAVGGTKALIKREINLAMRTTQTAFQCFSVYFMLIVFAIVFGLMFKNTLKIPEDSGIVVDDGNIFFIVCASLTAMLPSAMNAAVTSVSREGTALASLKTLPIDGKKIANAKIITWLVPALAAEIIAIVIANVMYFDAIRLVLSLVLFSALTVALTVFGVLWDFMSPKLKWTNPIQAVKGNAHSNIGMFIGMGAGFVLIAASFVMFFLGASSLVFNLVFWMFLFVEAVIFGVLDAVLYRKVDLFYGRIEI